MKTIPTAALWGFMVAYAAWPACAQLANAGFRQAVAEHQKTPSGAEARAVQDKNHDLEVQAEKVPTQSIDLGGGVTMEFVRIQSGSFVMGANEEYGDEKPVHRVTITKPFYLGRYEVTQAQWQAVMGGNPSLHPGDKNPVENVSWDDCQQFVARLNGKLHGWKAALPTEAQWEYACRAGGDTARPADTEKLNAWGLYHLPGNVLEWCNDWYGPYPSGAQVDPQGPASGASRVLRGGAFGYFIPGYVTSGSRYYCPPGFRYVCNGLRVVLVGVGTSR